MIKKRTLTKSITPSDSESLALIVSDLHFTENNQDFYRWKIFDEIENAAKEFNCTELLILGDIFHKKDRHPSELVNKFVQKLIGVSSLFKEIKILKGNHDYIDSDSPFLDFLQHFPKVQWISSPSLVVACGVRCLWLPHTHSPVALWDATMAHIDEYSYVFMHQSVIGCELENGVKMDNGSVSMEYLKQRFCDAKKIYSGDIHVPQTLGSGFFTYIGAPYPINFDDNYEARMLMLVAKDGDFVKEISIPLNIFRKRNITISSAKDLLDVQDLQPEDQVQIRVVLEDSESWNKVKEETKVVCDRLGLNVKSITLISKEEQKRVAIDTSFKDLSKEEIFKKFCKEQNIGGKKLEIGMNLLGMTGAD